MVSRLRGGKLVLRAIAAGRWSTISLILLSLLDTAASMGIPALIGVTVNRALTNGPGDVLVIVVLALLGVGIAVESLIELTDYAARIRALRILRIHLIGHLFRLGFRGQRKFNQGDLVNRLTDSTEQTAQAADVLNRLLAPLLTSVGGIVALFVIDYRLGLTFVIAGPIIVLVTSRHILRITKLSISAAHEQADVATRLMDAIRGLRTIRASGTVDKEISRVLRPAAQLRTLSLDIWRQQRQINFETTIVAPLLMIVVLGVAGYGLVAGRLNAGELLAASSYLSYAMGIFQQTGSIGEIGQLIASAQRVQAVLDEPALPTGPRPLPDGGGALRFEEVGASVAGRQILRGVTFDVPAGRTAAIVGESGVGKTTLTAMAGGLLAPDAGTVTFDGASIGELNAEELRKAVVYAFERPNLLGDTIADSLRYGDDSISDARLHAALRSAGAEDFVARLPQRMDTPLAGLRLSGGEIQRLGLARAACRGARLIVMDDALSSVDTATEAAISSALQQACRGATRLLIAHRASTAARADFVVWLHDGTLAGIGTHRELLADPAYRRVFAVAEDPVAELTSGS